MDDGADTGHDERRGDEVLRDRDVIGQVADNEGDGDDASHLRRQTSSPSAMPCNTCSGEHRSSHHSPVCARKIALRNQSPSHRESLLTKISE